MFKKLKHILWYREINKSDGLLVGGKNASLGEMIQFLGPKGVRTPGGYAVTASAYRYFLKKNLQLKFLGKKWDVSNVEEICNVGEFARNALSTIYKYRQV